MAKNKTFSYNFLLTIDRMNWLRSWPAWLQHQYECQAKVLMKVPVSVNSKMSGSKSFRGSLVINDSNNDVMYCYVCRKALRYCWQNWICYRKKKFKRASLVYHNKRLKFFNVVSEKKNSQLNIFGLIQGIYKLYTNKYILELYSTNSGK